MPSAQAAPREGASRQGISHQGISHQAMRAGTAAAAEAVSALELERSVFDSSETEILSAAFEKAWAYVEFDPTLGVLETCERKSELARCLMAILKLGDNNATSIANSAIALMRKNQSRILRAHIASGVSSRRLSVAR